MNDGEREQMSSAYRSVLNEIRSDYAKATSSPASVRLLHLEEKADAAEAICLQDQPEMLLKLRLARRNDVWYLVDILQTDNALPLVSEMLQPTIATIERSRAGEKVPPGRLSDFLRVLVLIKSNSPKSVSAADELLKTRPADKRLRFLKALALVQQEKEPEAIKLLRELSNSEPERLKASAQASFAIGAAYSMTKRYAEALRLLNAAAQLAKTWSSPHTQLAYVYRKMSNWNAALKSAQHAVELDADDSEAHYERACALARLGRIKQAMAAVEKAVELDPDLAPSLADEKDLKALSTLPAFKKLIPPPEQP